ncbi:hypothetical protein [Stomatobaculum longum]|uniref:hypothetical protein n=1 Tax=Stomatobaculum longum TaxID=796942 RepID=UPI00280553C4|nr:hypothetical protein [Stomatobaculum longum]
MNQLGKRYALLIPIAAVFALLFALTRLDFSHYPKTALDGSKWNKKWEMLGSLMGISDHPAGMHLIQNSGVLAGEETFYANYAAGEGSPYVNAEGKTVTLYPSQCYLLLYGCADAEAAKRSCEEWVERTRSLQAVHAEETMTHHGADYRVLLYEKKQGDSPYTKGASAFYVLDRFVVSAELLCTTEEAEEPATLLASFLEHVYLGYAD